MPKVNGCQRTSLRPWRRRRWARASTPGFLARSNQHLMTEVGADDRDPVPGGTIVGESQVTGACADIEDRRGADRRHQLCRPPAPVVIDVQAEQMVEQIVTRRNVGK